MKKAIIFWIFILIFPVKSQDFLSKAENPTTRVGVQSDATPLVLKLEEAIKLALENNNEIEIARNEVKLQESQLKSLLGTFDPVFTVTPQFTRTSTTGSRASDDFRVNAAMTKFLRYGGGSYRIFFNNVQTENTFSQAQISSGAASGTSKLYSSNLGISITQPLWRNFLIDENRRQIKIQRKRLTQSDADFRRQVIEIISRVQKAYWDLVFALKDQQNKVANLNLSKENLRQIEAKIAAGLSAPIAKAEVNTEIANREAEVLLAVQQVSIAENTLKGLIFKDTNTEDWKKSIIPVDEPIFDENEKVDLEDAITQAMRNRPELKRLKLELEINKIDKDFFKNQTQPQIDLTANLSLNGFSFGKINTQPQNLPIISGNPATNPDAFLLQQINLVRANLNPSLPPVSSPVVTIPGSPNFLSGGFNRSIANMFRKDAPNYSFGLTISFPFKNQVAEANLASSEINKQRIEAQIRSTEQGILTEVRNAVQAVETARQRVLAARQARKNAEIQLEGERKLFEAGRSTTFLLFQRENALANAKNAEIRAETDYKKAIVDLQKATSTILQANNIEIR
ncbi:MAG: TolC family protein [Pyrinomonadaceae bacterium]|nr:TolC family protein [Pyrinomonadaceae bacterium]